MNNDSTVRLQAYELLRSIPKWRYIPGLGQWMCWERGCAAGHLAAAWTVTPVHGVMKRLGLEMNEHMLLFQAAGYSRYDCETQIDGNFQPKALALYRFQRFLGNSPAGATAEALVGELA